MVRKESVDRRLLTIACCCLLLELALFLGGLGMLPFSPWRESQIGAGQNKLGEIQTARRNVRRRGFDSNIWEDSATKDFVYENDSILTLSDSSARLKLRGGLNLDIQENTLVVLEANSGDSERPFRLRFSRGDVRAKGSLGRLQVHSGEWVVTATKGSDLSMRAVDSQRVEVEVHSGDVHVAHSVHGQVRELTSDQKLILFPEEAGEVVAPSRDLTWSDIRPKKVYAHEFPITTGLEWTGEAESLEVLSPGKGTVTHQIKPKQTAIHLTLQPGSHHLTLKSGTEVSRTLALQVMQAPKIIHLTPLPRDRVKTNHPLLFAWLSEINATSYRMELATDPGFKHIVHFEPSKEARLHLPMPVPGQLYWRVLTYDDDGVVIPPAYSYPLISHPDPLARPKLRSPTATESPDEARSRQPSPHWMDRLMSLILPRAHGQEVRHLPPVIFNWDAVPGAEFYVIEISTTADFSNPEVIAKTSTNTYAWGRFTKRVYYYRVAGGTKGGRVGYFSAPERVDLTNWPPPKLKRETTAADSATQKPAPVPTPPPRLENKATLVEAPPLHPESPSPHATAITGKLWWRGVYASAQESAAETTKASRSGASPIGIGVELAGARAQGWWRAELKVAQFTWQPKSESTWPFQPEQQTLSWNLGLHLSSQPLGWTLGLTIGQSPLLSRVDQEEVALENNLSYGPLLAGTFQRGKTTHAHALALTYSTEMIQVVSQNHWRWHFTPRHFLGAEGDLTYGFGDDRSLTHFDLGIQFGVCW